MKRIGSSQPFATRDAKHPGAHDIEYLELVRTVAKNFSQLRVAKWLTQDLLAEKTKIKRSTLSYIESGIGNPSLYYLFKLSQFYKLPLRQILEKRYMPPKKHVLPVDMFEKHVLAPESIIHFKLPPFKKFWLKSGAEELAVTGENCYEALLKDEVLEVHYSGDYKVVNPSAVMRAEFFTLIG